MPGVISETMGMDIFAKVECGSVEKHPKRRPSEHQALVATGAMVEEGKNLKQLAQRQEVNAYAFGHGGQRRQFEHAKKMEGN